MFKKVSLLIIFFALLICLAGCQSKKEMPLFTVDTYPRVDGSTVTIPLSEAIAARLTGLSTEEIRPHILHNKTHEAYVNLINNKADIIFVTSPSEEELTLAKQKGIQLEIIPIVCEGFVFLTHADNPVKGLTLQEIRQIYSGSITNWSEVGGYDIPIVAYQRPVNSGSQTGLLDLVMKDLPLMDPPMEKVIAGMGQLIDAVAVYENVPDALGYSYYYFVVDMWGNQNIKLLEIDGVYPTPETISNGRYPITTAYYAVIRADEGKNSPARTIINWIVSEGGQTLAEETGYVKVR